MRSLLLFFFGCDSFINISSFNLLILTCDWWQVLPFYSDTTKNNLIASTYIHLKCNKFAKYASDLPSVSPRILLSGPAGTWMDLQHNGLWVFFFHYFLWWFKVFFPFLFLVGSDIYQETLVKALANHFGARLLIVDSLLLPGVSYLHSILNYCFLFSSSKFTPCFEEQVFCKNLLFICILRVHIRFELLNLHIFLFFASWYTWIGTNIEGFW